MEFAGQGAGRGRRGPGMMQLVQVREGLALEGKEGILLPLKHRGRR